MTVLPSCLKVEEFSDGFLVKYAVLDPPTSIDLATFIYNILSCYDIPMKEPCNT
jgi:hypothetical protein